MVDIHTHILPDFDDGSKSMEMSERLLNEMSKNGVHTVVCTPHFRYVDCSCEEFVEKRDRAVDELRPVAEKYGIKLLRGCEVYLNERMLSLENVDGLCIEGTRYILVEFPFDRPQTEQDFLNLENFCNYYNITPIIAHTERYITVIKKIKTVERFLSLGAHIQVNGASFTDKRFKRTARELIKRGYTSIIASDTHNDTFRPPSALYSGYAEIERKFGIQMVNELKQNAEDIISE